MYDWELDAQKYDKKTDGKGIDLRCVQQLQLPQVVTDVIIL
jgi:hypothetical protein